MKAKGEIISNVLGVLSGIPLFSKLSESSCSFLACESRFKHVEKGEVLFFQHDPSESACIVHTGAVSIILQSSDGREMVINESAALTGFSRATGFDQQLLRELRSNQSTEITGVTLS